MYDYADSNAMLEEKSKLRRGGNVAVVETFDALSGCNVTLLFGKVG